MIYIALNIVPILIATLAGLAIGAVVWRRAASDVALRRLLPFALVAEFWLASILAGALILAPPRGSAWTMALGSAFVIWIGFVVPALIVTQRVRGVRWGAIGTDCAHWLVVMLVQAAVMQGWELVAPPVG